MKVQFLKTLVDGNVTTKKGTVDEIADWYAKELIAMGYVVEIPEPKGSPAAPLVAQVVPFEEPRTGGPDGLEKPASSLQADPAPKKRTYKKRAASADS